jgi:NAD(P)-dependent dehydrogenase (short-subunit alcohol dehydrogenase family)
MRLNGKVAVVTGAGSGIGLATTEVFSEEGASIVAADVSGERLEQLHGRENMTTLIADVSVRADAERMISLAIERFGRLDVLVNNAGILDRFLPVADVSDEIWNRILAVNLTGPMLTSRAAVPRMLEQGGGVIVNISSVAGLAGAKGGAAYTASKHGVLGLTRNIAATYGRDGIRAIAICPGATATNIDVSDLDTRGIAAIDLIVQASPRQADPREIAAVILFAASDEARFVNGAALVADGGWTAY